MGRLKMEQGNKERMFLMRREDLTSIFDLFCFCIFPAADPEHGLRNRVGDEHAPRRDGGASEHARREADPAPGDS